MGRTINLILNFGSIVVCSTISLITFLAFILMDRASMPILSHAILGNFFISLAELIISVFYVLAILNNQFIRLVLKFSYTIMYVEIEVSFTAICWFVYGVLQYMPWGQGSNSFCFPTIFVIMGIYRSLLVYTSSYCTIFKFMAPNPIQKEEFKLDQNQNIQIIPFQPIQVLN